MPWNEQVKRRLKLRDLDILMAVIESGSMGKAAERLAISQPSISKSIVDLERVLGVKLLDRSRRGVVPTPFGQALRKRGAVLFNDIREAVQDIDFLSDPTKGEIHIGSTEPLISALISPLIDRLSRQYRYMFFHVIAGDTSIVCREVLQHRVELAVCRVIGPLPGELSAEIIFHDSLAVMTSMKNPLIRRRNIMFDDLSDEPWVFFPYDSLIGALVANMFRANGREPPALTVTSLSFNMQMELLATGRFLTVLPTFLLKTAAGRNQRLKALPVALRNSNMPVGIVTLKNRTVTPLAQLFIEAIRAQARALA